MYERTNHVGSYCLVWFGTVYGWVDACVLGLAPNWWMGSVVFGAGWVEYCGIGLLALGYGNHVASIRGLCGMFGVWKGC